MQLDVASSLVAGIARQISIKVYAAECKTSTLKACLVCTIESFKLLMHFVWLKSLMLAATGAILLSLLN